MSTENPYVGTYRLLCELLGRPPGHQTWHGASPAEVGNSFPFGPVVQACRPKSVEIATGLDSFPEAPDFDEKLNSSHPGMNMKAILARAGHSCPSNSGGGRSKTTLYFIKKKHDFQKSCDLEWAQTVKTHCVFQL